MAKRRYWFQNSISSILKQLYLIFSVLLTQVITSWVCFHYCSLWYYQNPIIYTKRRNWITGEMNAEKIRGSVTAFLMTPLPPSHFLSPFSWTPLNILSYFLNDPWSGCNWLGWIKLLLKISLYYMYKLIFSIKLTPIIYFYTKSQRTQHKLNIYKSFLPGRGEAKKY